MANCPKCGKHLKLKDWRQHCPHCGANIVVYDLQERLMQQADIAEVQHYHFQKKVDRLKGAFIGSPLAIARIFTSLLPIGPLFLTIMTAKLSAPLEPFEGKLNILEIYNNIDKLGGVTGLFSTGNSSDLMFAIGLALFVLSLLATFLHFALNTLACSPKGKIRNTIIDIIILVTTIGSVGCLLFMGDGGAAVVRLGIGAYLYVVLQLVNTILDFILLRKGIEIKHAQCYCGGIPIEEYFEMVEKGMTQAEIREEQYKRLMALQEEKEAQLKAAEEEAARKEAEKEAQKNG